VNSLGVLGENSQYIETSAPVRLIRRQSLGILHIVRLQSAKTGPTDG
jgi:hypothetical protein